MDIQSLDLSKAVKIDGWMSYLELECLAELAKESKNILEFGAYKGRSTRALCDNTDGFVTTVDPWTPEYYDKNNNLVNYIDPDAGLQFYHNLKDHIDSGRLRTFIGFSAEYYTYYRGPKPDMIFIDGDHRYEAVRKDILFARRVIAPAGIICGHDYGRNDWPDVQRAVDEIFVKPERLVDTIWIQRF